LDCATCDARIATMNNNDALRKETASKWQKMYNVPDLSFEAINCTGCMEDGVKFAHCDTCEIRKCAIGKGFRSCGECSEVKTCEIVAMVHMHVPEALNNLLQII